MQVRSRLSHAALMRTLSIVCRTDLSDPLVTLVTKKSSSWSAISSVAKCWKEAVIKCDKITEAPCKRREHLSNLLLSFFFVLIKGNKGKFSYIFCMQFIPVLLGISPNNFSTL